MYYIHTDHPNTPRRISRASDNQIVWRWDNDPFGRHTANEDPDGDSQLFTFSLRYPGQYYDEETGLHYNYFRDYDPSLGRYLQSDPIGLQGGINTYLYTNANPLVYIDPLGLAPGMGSRGASAMEAIGDAIDQGLCGWWPGHPDCWSMCVRWRCERDGDCGEKEYYSIGRGSPYVASPSYDPNNDDKCECVMRCVPGQPNCRGLNTQ
ncbi:RHS repeat domain-containing protein [Marinobacterium marinum]|uniref:RHS repeat domain-containing protein n=1 Tax=Marinobacterium marinum TaxID=2756129 RepID=UPI003899559D